MKNIYIVVAFLFVLISGCVKLPDTMIKTEALEKPVCPPGISCAAKPGESNDEPSWPGPLQGRGNVVEFWFSYHVSQAYVSFYPTYNKFHPTNELVFEKVPSGDYFVNFGRPDNVWVLDPKHGTNLNYRVWYRINNGTWREFTNEDATMVNHNPLWVNLKMTVP